MDRITNKLLEDFLVSQELTKTNDSDDFELFSNYIAVSNEYNKSFDPVALTVGKGNDTGIDGIAIIVNGRLIEDTNEVDDLLTSNGYLEVTYVFIQAKTSSNFDTTEMRSFYYGVNDFFSEDPKLPRNEDVTKFSEISNYILEKASDFKENPKCKTYYITTGVLNLSDPHISAVTIGAKEDLLKNNLFEVVDIHVLGANEVGKLYRKTKNPITAKFYFANKVTLPEVEGIEESYFGVLPFSEFKNLLIDENGNIQNVFDDNVRDFQGTNNLVNSSINETLTGENPNIFSVLNNGITIVADSIKSSANFLTVTDYQIVNGCQTSNVLFENRKNQSLDNIFIPLRLIATKDENIKSQITVSTNNQTAIKKEQLSVMSDFQKNLQHYYASITGDGKLYYERRTKEFYANRDIPKKRIVTVATQLKAFSSMFNKDPHMVTTYFGTLVKNMTEGKSNLFQDDHQFAPYYLAGLALYRLDSLFVSGDLDKRFRKVKFYLLMLVPMIATKLEVPPLNSQKKVEKYCDEIISKLNDSDKCIQIFNTAADIIIRSKAAIEDKQSLKSKTMTGQILGAYSNEKVE
jgi:hypothetical protein